MICWLAASCGVTAAAEENAAGGWSADLLHRILQADAPQPAVAAPPATAEMVLRTYHLSHLHVAEAGRAQNVLAILERLLPPGSSLKPDVPANSLHVMTTAAAHQAAWEYLSAVDVPDSAPPAVAPAIPDDVRAALQKFADAGDQSAKLLAAVGAMRTDVTAEMAQLAARQREQTLRLLVVGGAVGLLLVVTFVWTLRRRTPAAAAAPPDSGALVLAPEQLTTALAPVHDKMRNDMLGLLNEVAIKLQAQHNEQQKLVREQQRQLEDARLALADERRQFMSQAGTMVVEAVERVDATTAKLAKQQDKVAELVQELQNTVRELDETKDDLRTKEVELEQERAKIAALSILLEEGGSPPLHVSPAPNGAAPAAAGRARATETVSSPCTNPDAISVPPPDRRTITPGPSRFQFLPPDHPET